MENCNAYLSIYSFARSFIQSLFHSRKYAAKVHDKQGLEVIWTLMMTKCPPGPQKKKKKQNKRFQITFVKSKTEIENKSTKEKMR